MCLENGDQSFDIVRGGSHSIRLEWWFISFIVNGIAEIDPKVAGKVETGYRGYLWMLICGDAVPTCL